MNVLMSLSDHLRHIGITWCSHNRNWVIAAANKLILVFIVSSFVAIVWRWHLLPPMVPLWYSRPWGTDRLAAPAWLFILPIGSLFWYMVSVVMTTYVTIEYLIFTQIAYLATLLVSFLSFVTLIKILFLVT